MFHEKVYRNGGDDFKCFNVPAGFPTNKSPNLKSVSGNPDAEETCQIRSLTFFYAKFVYASGLHG